MGSLKKSQTSNSNHSSKKFEETFSLILDDISFILNDQPKGELKTWIKSVVEYNVPHGKKIRGKLVETAYIILSGKMEEKNIQKAQILGWCVEILQAAFLVVDDLMDNGTTRRGQPCWYKVNNMGSIVANDALLLENLVYQIVKKHFGSSSLYADMLDLILGVSFNTMLGQSLDTRYSNDYSDKNRYLDQSTMQLYLSIATLKTSYYTIYLPIALAMVFSGFGRADDDDANNKQLWKDFHDIALKIGTFFQIQDDYFDCFTEREKMGKEGSDIQEGKCSWLYAKALELADSKQKKIIRENYGRNGIENVSQVKQLYLELDLPNEFLKIKRKMTTDILGSIDKLNNPKLEILLERTFKQIKNRIC